MSSFHFKLVDAYFRCLYHTVTQRSTLASSGHPVWRSTAREAFCDVIYNAVALMPRFSFQIQFPDFESVSRGKNKKVEIDNALGHCGLYLGQFERTNKNLYSSQRLHAEYSIYSY